MNIILNYLEVGIILSVIVNIGLWITNNPNLTFLEVLATILVWPVVVKEFILLQR